jgi:HEPN domain-containing protein
MVEMSYKYFGERDLKEAEILLKAEAFSSAGRFAQQAVEKHLKQYIGNNGSTNDINLLATHNTVNLYERVVELGGLEFCENSHQMMFVLRSYYYDTNYPGANARELGEREATKAVDFAKEFIASIKWKDR